MIRKKYGVVSVDQSEHCLLCDNFIKNRFENINQEYYILYLKKTRQYIQYFILNKVCYLGIWLLPINKLDLKRICKYIFKKHPEIESIEAEFSLSRIGVFKKVCCYYLTVPEKLDDLDKMISHKHLREQNKCDHKLCDFLGEKNILNYSKKDCPDYIMDFYFKHKGVSKGINYGMSKFDYFKKYQVSDIYALTYGKTIVSVIMSCEQYQKCYLQNLTYDNDYSVYSPGKILYHEYLKQLICKKKTELILGGGDYQYKKRYNASSVTTFDFKIYKMFYINLYYKIKLMLKV